MSNPTVSAIVATWNHGDYLRDAVVSILNQTFEDFEVIIVADESPDNTIEVAERMVDKDERVTLIVNNQREYYTRSLNIGIENTSGDYIAINDSDDLSSRKRFEKQIEYMEQNPNTVLTVQHDFYSRVVDGEGNIRNQYFKPDNYDYPPESGIFPRAMTRVHSSCMYRNVGQRYREKFIHSQDVDMFVRCLASEYDVKIMKEDLTTRRHHENQKQARNLKATAEDLNARWGLNQVAIEDWYNHLRGWPLRYPKWEPDLPYEPEDHSPHAIFYR